VQQQSMMFPFIAVGKDHVLAIFVFSASNMPGL
jgi:hypothetical protein